MSKVDRLAAIFWWLFSFYLLLLKPAGEGSGIPHFDKVGHFVLFAVWAGLLLRVFGVEQWRTVLLFCFAWALSSEAAQGLLTATRSAEWLDVTADMAGALLVVLLCCWWRNRPSAV